MRKSWAVWLKIAHAALAVVLSLYLLMVAINSVLFGYSFWNDPPPNAAADVVAVASLWVLALVTCLIGAIAYVWMFEFSSDPGDDLAPPFRRALSATVRRWWIAVPGFAMTVLTCAVFLPGIVAVALLGPLPFRPGQARVPNQLYRQLHSFGGIATVVALVVACTVSGAVLVGTYLVSRFDGAVEMITALLAYASYLSSALAAGWAASRFASSPVTPSTPS